MLAPFLLWSADSYCFPPSEVVEAWRREMHERRQTPDGFGNNTGTHRTEAPEIQPGEHYTRDSYRRAIDRRREKAWRPSQAPL